MSDENTANEIQKILNNEEAFNEVVSQVFNVVDTDGSGQIDSQELYTAVSNVFEEMGQKAPTKDQTDCLLKDLDTDKSGKLSKSEFSVLVRKLLESFLTNE
jgi:Ca2+-binding EF-hand superfamily protein